MKTMLIGTGPMSKEYFKVLKAQGRKLIVVGRSADSSKLFEAEMDSHVETGGLSAALRKFGPPKAAIVCVGVENLATCVNELINFGTKLILVEKPGGLNINEIQGVKDAAEFNGAQVWVAYNRRFYESVLTADRIISGDGGAVSMHFEFTEWANKIRTIYKAPGVKDNWVFANSTHVIDTAFYLCGMPESLSNFHSGALDWHPKAARFCGAGVTGSGVLFSYLADWESAGRWGIEILTRKRRLILRPLETLQEIMVDSLEAKKIELDDSLDKLFKPGLYKQVEAFFNGESKKMCSISQQLEMSIIYMRIAGYK